MSDETTLHDRLTWSRDVAKMAYGWQMMRPDKKLTGKETQMLDELIGVAKDMKGVSE